MAKILNKEELSDLMATVRKAGYAEGYAQAKLDMALGQMSDASVEDPPQLDPVLAVSEELQTVAVHTETPQADDVYKTRTTVKTTKAIALNYIKSAAPRIVGPTEIKKNSEKAHNIVISFGTLKRAIGALIEEGEIEQVEESRWRYKSRAADGLLRSVK